MFAQRRQRRHSKAIPACAAAAQAPSSYYARTTVLSAHSGEASSSRSTSAGRGAHHDGRNGSTFYPGLQPVASKSSSSSQAPSWLTDAAAITGGTYVQPTGPALPARAQLEYARSISVPTAVAGLGLQQQGLKGSSCRFCPLMFSSSSNRHRHERLKHGASLQALDESSSSGAAAAAAVHVGHVHGGRSRDESALRAFGSATARGLGVVAKPAQLSTRAPNGAEVETRLGAAVAERWPVEFQVLSPESDSSAQPDLDEIRVANQESNEIELELEESDQAEQQLDQSDVHVSDGMAVESELELEPLRHRANTPEPSAAAVDVHAHPTGSEDCVDWSMVDGARPLLSEDQLQAACYPFLCWLGKPPITSCEALVKARRVRSMSQLQPIKSTLRFIFALLWECKAVESVDLAALARLSVCEALNKAVTDRQVASGRVHAIMLLVKKALVYLSSLESTRTRQYVQPTQMESFMYVDGICADSSHLRKQAARNRMVLGHDVSREAQAAHSSQRARFEVPKTWSASAESNEKQQAAALASPPLLTPVPAAAAAVPPSTMSKDEFQHLTQACLRHLNGELQGRLATEGAEPQQLQQQQQSADDWLYTHYLVTATLCLGMAPRCQVFQKLQLGSSFSKEADGLFWIKMLAQQSKNGKPTLFALAKELTPAYDAYLQVVRPRLIAAALSRRTASGLNSDQAPSDLEHNFVFFKRNGTAPRMDFSTSTNLVTQAVLGRPINAHAFRSSVITAVYSSGASQADMNMLANIMAHDPATARNFYYKPQHALATVQTGQRLAEQLLAPAACVAPAAAGASAAAAR